MFANESAAVWAAEWTPRVIITSLYLVAALLVGAIVIAIVSRWVKRSGTERLSPGDQLSHFRSLYEEGTIDAAEFARLRKLLTDPFVESTLGKKPPAAPTSEQAANPPANGESAPGGGIRPS